jgi:hypothetical protein
VWRFSGPPHLLCRVGSTGPLCQQVLSSGICVDGVADGDVGAHAPTHRRLRSFVVAGLSSSSNATNERCPGIRWSRSPACGDRLTHRLCRYGSRPRTRRAAKLQRVHTSAESARFTERGAHRSKRINQMSASVTALVKYARRASGANAIAKIARPLSGSA